MTNTIALSPSKVTLNVWFCLKGALIFLKWKGGVIQMFQINPPSLPLTQYIYYSFHEGMNPPPIGFSTTHTFSVLFFRKNQKLKTVSIIK